MPVMVSAGVGSPPLKMKTAVGERKGERGLAAGWRESTAGRKAFRKRRPGEAVGGMVWSEPVWVNAFAIVLVYGFVCERECVP